MTIPHHPNFSLFSFHLSLFSTRPLRPLLPTTQILLLLAPTPNETPVGNCPKNLFFLNPKKSIESIESQFRIAFIHVQHEFRIRRSHFDDIDPL